MLWSWVKDCECAMLLPCTPLDSLFIRPGGVSFTGSLREVKGVGAGISRRSREDEVSPLHSLRLPVQLYGVARHGTLGPFGEMGMEVEWMRI